MLGSGGFHPTETRHTAGVIVPECGVLFDAGTSMFRLASQITRPELQIFLSHAHWDHIIGLTFLLVPMLDRRLTRVRLYAGDDVLHAVRHNLFDPQTFPLMPAFEFCPLQEGAEVKVEGGVVRHQKLPSHPRGSRAFRLEAGGSSLAYVTDTATDGTYTGFLKGTDCLIHESNFADGHEALAKQTGHSCLTPVARIAKEAKVGRLLINHMDPSYTDAVPFDLSPAKKIFPKSEFAYDMMSFDV